MARSTTAPDHVSDPASRRFGSREFGVLCACATVPLPPDRLERIAVTIEGGIEWGEFLRMAEHHGLTPMVTANLTNVPNIPPEIADFLHSSFETNVRRTLWFESEMLRIASHLEDSGIQVVPYKGPLLAEHAYGDVALRNFGDLDFLIAPSRYVDAKHALAELGYQPAEELSQAVEAFWRRYGYERSFGSHAGKYLVELQWGLFPHFFAIDLRVEKLLERSRFSSVGGKPVRDLSAEDTLMVLCLHAAKHLWLRLIWLCDISQTVRTKPIDYPLLLSRAAELGITRFVTVSFWLANRLLNSEVPQEVSSCIDCDRQVPVLGEGLVARLSRSATYDFESTEYFRWIFRLRERGSDKSLYLWRLLSTPGVGDIKMVRLPGPLFPLYRFVRIARLLRRFVFASPASAARVH